MELKPYQQQVINDLSLFLEHIQETKDVKDAFEMLKNLSNSTHQVITSVSFKTNDKVTTLHDYTEVTFAELSDEMIQYYISNFKPFDKAGSYGIQDWIGLVGVTSVVGSYTNVMGLPTHLVYDFFKKL